MEQESVALLFNGLAESVTTAQQPPKSTLPRRAHAMRIGLCNGLEKRNGVKGTDGRDATAFLA